LFRNSLTGSIPDSLGSLTSLLQLCVAELGASVLAHALCRCLYSNALLSGTIPSSLGSLASLESLCVHMHSLAQYLPPAGCVLSRPPCAQYSVLDELEWLHPRLARQSLQTESAVREAHFAISLSS